MEHQNIWQFIILFQDVTEDLIPPKIVSYFVEIVIVNCMKKRVTLLGKEGESVDEEDTTEDTEEDSW